jgi:hypothetical protein
MFKDIQPGKTNNERKYIYIYIYIYISECMCHVMLNLNEF